MTRVTIHAAKTHLSRLIRRACAGEDIIIARGATPVARLVPMEPAGAGRVFGAMRGRARVDDAFFEPSSEDELAAWER